MVELTHALIIRKLPNGSHEIVVGDLKKPIAVPQRIETPGFATSSYTSIANILRRRGVVRCSIRIEKKASPEFARQLKEALEEKGILVRAKV